MADQERWRHSFPWSAILALWFWRKREFFDCGRLADRLSTPHQPAEAIRKNRDSNRRAFALRFILCARLSLRQQMDDYEKRIIEAALVRNNWVRTDAADDLGINVSTLWRKMTALGIDAPGAD